ncbi:MAG: hypothetical protein H7067_09035, partial [Burkholderiales bacterium]|nr:hypothetical protein [Opitutaceae bacterium]
MSAEPEEPSPLEAFPGQVASLLEAVADARVAIAESVLSHVATGRAGPWTLGVPRIGPVDFEWRFRIVRGESGRLFFFFKRPEKQEVVVESRLRWRILPVPPLLDGAPRPPLRWECIVRGPRFLVTPALRPAPIDVRTFDAAGLVPGRTPDAAPDATPGHTPMAFALA